MRTVPTSLSQSRPGPDFLCIGAQKAGTQWLYDQLQHHPDFWMPPIKELQYFYGGRRQRGFVNLVGDRTRDLHQINAERARAHDRALDERDLQFLVAFRRLSEGGYATRVPRLLAAGSALVARAVPRYSTFHRNVVWAAVRTRPRPNFRGYAALFTHKGAALSGDVTPAYSVLGPSAVRRIITELPGVKVVFFARDPVERFWSAVGMHVRQEKTSWPEDLRALRRLLAEPGNIHRSYQTRIVSKWRRVVQPQNFGLFLFDDLLADPSDFRRRVLTFLGANPAKPSGDLTPGFNRKADQSKRPLPAQFRDFLGQSFADELRGCASDFGGAAAAWPGRYGV